MDSVPYLLFRFRGQLYGIKALDVKELLWLPELTPIPETPNYIVGIFNLRGKTIDVMDLDVRFGYQQGRYILNDIVIVLEKEDRTTGIIANEGAGIENILPAQIEIRPPYLREREIKNQYLEGVAKVENEIIMLLDIDNLIHKEEHIEIAPGEHKMFCPEASPEELEVFRGRALNFSSVPEEIEISGQVPLAVVGMGEEYFGVYLDLVREFAKWENITPLPCCPKHVIGNMNLRGEILLVIDVRGMLDLAAKEPDEDAMVLIIETPEMRTGLLIENIYEVLYIRAAEIKAVPAVIKKIEQEYIKGSFPYRGRMLGILDLSKVLAREDLVVNKIV